MSGLAAIGVRQVTFDTILGWTLLRTTLIAVVVVVSAGPIALWFKTARCGWRRKLAAALVLAPLPTPGVVVGYAYSAFELSLVRHPWANEGRYAALLAMLLLPVAVGVLYFSPRPAVSASAQYCRRLLPATCLIARGRIGAGWSFAMHGPLRAKLMAWL